MRTFFCSCLLMGLAVLSSPAYAQMVPLLPQSIEATPDLDYICLDELAAQTVAQAFRDGGDDALTEQMTDAIMEGYCHQQPSFYDGDAATEVVTYWNGTRSLTVMRDVYIHGQQLYFIYSFRSHRGT